jgi:hypothetical protein
MKYFRSTQYPIEFVLSEHINKNFGNATAVTKNPKTDNKAPDRTLAPGSLLCI